MTERRYDDDEVSRIFERAAEEQLRAGVPALLREEGAAAAPLTEGEGMTLADLQEIGREVGIPPEFVTRAATSLERTGTPSERRYLGLPLGVGRVVPLKRQLNDAEWERLVVDLRETFDAAGRLREEGAFRQWSNGNLKALVEPTESGHQLRLKTLNGSAFAWMNAGLAMLGVSGIMLVISAFGGSGNLAPFTMVAAMGAAMFGFGAIRLPSWARTRRRQMEEIAERVAATPALPPKSD